MPSSRPLAGRFAAPWGVALALLAPAVAAEAPPAAPPAPAPAAPEPRVVTVEGRILGTEEGSLVVDVGKGAGAAAGDVAELWRPVELRHPVTRRPVTDRYRIGSLRLTEVLELVSFAAPAGAPRHAPRPGDVVVLHVERAAPAPKAQTAQPAPTAPMVARDPDAEAVGALLESLGGRGLSDRIALVEAWRRDHSASRFAPSLGEELFLLRQLAARDEARAGDAAEAASPPSGEAPVPAVPRVHRFEAPPGAVGGAPLELGVELSGTPRGAVLQSRHAGEVSYVSTPMRPAGERYWVATLPAARVRAPGLEYFVEAVDASGDAEPVVGEVSHPLRLSVADPPKPDPRLGHRSTVSVATDFADYNRLRGNDRVWQTEGMFGIRLGDRGVRAVRSGFGVYRGIGGSVRELDDLRLAPRKVGLTYGQLEGEFGFSATTSALVRAVLGLADDGVSGGGQLHLRIGSDLGTNLLVGGELLGGIGLRGVAQLEFLPQGRVPVVVRTEVTNQPAGVQGNGARGLSGDTSDVGGRAVVQVGYRLVPALVASARASYQGRTIVHGGPGFGGGVTYEW